MSLQLWDGINIRSDEVVIKLEDFKEFIKELKESIHWQMDGDMVIDLIDELVGDKLIW